MAKVTSVDANDIFEVFNRFHYVCDTQRFQKIFARADLCRMVSDVPGDIVDAGVYKGTSTIQFAHLLQTYQPNSRSRVVCFDTFEGNFPHFRQDEKQSAIDHMASYEASAYDRLIEAVRAQKLQDRVTVVKGDIIQTFPAFLKTNPGFRISLLHCDLDVYQPTLETLRQAWTRLVPGGIAVFDNYAEPNWGESDAVDEFFSSLKVAPKLKMLSSSPTPTAYCLKEGY